MNSLNKLKVLVDLMIIKNKMNYHLFNMLNQAELFL